MSTVIESYRDAGGDGPARWSTVARLMARDERPPPRECLVDDTWPDGEIKPGGRILPDGTKEPETPTAAQVLQILVWRLKTLMKARELSVNAVAVEAGLNPQTVHNLINGVSWPDAETICKLELALHERLWVNKELGRTIEPVGRTDFHRRSGDAFFIASGDALEWETAIAPTRAEPESWTWRTRRRTSKGWEPDGEGTAADHEAAEQAAADHIAGRGGASG